MQRLKTVHSSLPPGFRLTLNDCLILLHTEQHRNTAYALWPQGLKLPKAVEKLRCRRYLIRSYWPTKYNITRTGFSLVKWIHSSLEHAASKRSTA